MKRILPLLITLPLYIWGQNPDPMTPEPNLMIPESQQEIEKWLKLGKPRGYKTLPEKRVDYVGYLRLQLPQVISYTLENQWNVQIAESQVAKQGGVVQTAKGPFDPTIGADYQHDWLKDVQTFGFKTDQHGNIDTADLSLEKLARIGTRFALTGEVQREFNPSFSFDNSFNRTNATTLSFNIEQPLLRGFRYNTDSVNEVVTELELKALNNELTQTMAQNVRDSLLTYWDLVAAKQIVTINENAKTILETLATATEKLVEGERIAASELNEQFAELSRINRDLIAAEQEVYRLYNTLLFQMGSDRCRFPRNPPHLDLQEFPIFDVMKEHWDLDKLLCIAMRQRGDLIAARYRIDETQWNLRLAKQEIYPRLDLRGGVELYNTKINRRAKPFFASTETHRAQKDYTIAVNFSFPIFNNKALGEERQRIEDRSQAYLNEDRLSEDIRQAIATAFRDQVQLIDELYYAKKSVEWYEKALQDEILRFKNGYGSLFIIIDFENRLRFTLIEEVQTMANWAKNLVELLFQTGTLIERDLCGEMKIEMMNYKKLLNNE